MNQIYFITTNKYKIELANRLLGKHGWECVSTKVQLIEPQSQSQEEVSLFKARQAFEQTKSPVITMDSGIFINSLKGFPGIYTSEIFKVLPAIRIMRLLDDSDDRSAYIQQTISYADRNVVKSFIGRIDGSIVAPEEAKEGYDFDCFFRPDSSKKLLAELAEDERMAIWAGPWNQLGDFLNSLQL